MPNMLAQNKIVSMVQPRGNIGAPSIHLSTAKKNAGTVPIK